MLNNRKTQETLASISELISSLQYVASQVSDISVMENHARNIISLYIENLIQEFRKIEGMEEKERTYSLTWKQGNQFFQIVDETQKALGKITFPFDPTHLIIHEVASRKILITPPSKEEKLALADQKLESEMVKIEKLTSLGDQKLELKMMPIKREKLTDEEIQELIKHLTSESPNILRIEELLSSIDEWDLHSCGLDDHAAAILACIIQKHFPKNGINLKDNLISRLGLTAIGEAIKRNDKNETIKYLDISENKMNLVVGEEENWPYINIRSMVQGQVIDDLYRNARPQYIECHIASPYKGHWLTVSTRSMPDSDWPRMIDDLRSDRSLDFFYPNDEYYHFYNDVLPFFIRELTSILLPLAVLICEYNGKHRINFYEHSLECEKKNYDRLKKLNDLLPNNSFFSSLSVTKRMKYSLPRNTFFSSLSVTKKMKEDFKILLPLILTSYPRINFANGFKICWNASNINDAITCKITREKIRLCFMEYFKERNLQVGAYIDNSGQLLIYGSGVDLREIIAIRPEHPKQRR
jgi:hypothetical protein